MSDGGAAAIVEGTKLLWRVPGGKIILALIAGHLALSYVAAHASTTVLVLLGVLAAALVGLAGVFFFQRRKRRARAKLKQALVLIGLGLVVVVVAGIALVRRRQPTEALAPPTAEDVDAAAKELA